MTNALTGDEYLARISEKITNGINCGTGVSKTPYFKEADKLLTNYCNSQANAQQRARTLIDSLTQAVRFYREKDEIDEYLKHSGDANLNRHLQNYSCILDEKGAAFAQEAQAACQELFAVDTSYS